MQHPAEHVAFLARRDFVIPPGDFTDSERDLLARYGCWLEALATGAIHPATPGQEHFVLVSRGQREPQTDFERAWAKVLLQRNSVAEIVRAFQSLAHARATTARVEAEYLAARAAVLAQVRDQLNAVDDAFADRVKEAADASAESEKDVRELVLRLGRGVRLAGIRAAYYAGRVSWDNERMEVYARHHPEVAAFRKVGKAWVNLRFLDPPPDAGPGAMALRPMENGEREQMKELPPAGGDG